MLHNELINRKFVGMITAVLLTVFLILSSHRHLIQVPSCWCIRNASVSKKILIVLLVMLRGQAMPLGIFLITEPVPDF